MRIAVDWSPDLSRHATPNDQVVRAPSTAMAEVEFAIIDVVVISNFLQHLPDTAAPWLKSDVCCSQERW